MKRNSRLLRTISVLAVVAVVCVGLAIHTGVGTPSGWGIQDVAALCPLGGLEAALASKTIIPPLLIALAIVVGITLVVGRAFCAWGCPVPLLRRVFGLKEPYAKDMGTELRKRGGINDSRNWVLGGALLSTALFGFPVFCLICPVGLTFATVIVLWRLFQFAEVSWSLLVFPAILAVEVIALRKWCYRFCPLGALLSLIARGNGTLRPASDARMCLRTAQGEACNKCAQACPEGIDLHDKISSAPMNECTKCRACADACPMHAISFPFLPSHESTRCVETGKSNASPAEGNRQDESGEELGR